VRVQAQGSADGTDLVAEVHLQGVEAVVDVLRHLCHAEGHAEPGARQSVVEVCHHVAGPRVALAHHGLGRLEEVGDAGPLPQELRIHAHPEVDTDALAGGAFQDGDQDVLAGAREHRAPVDHRVPTRLLSQRSADLVADLLQVGRGQTTASRGRGAHADDRHVAGQDRDAGVLSHRQQTRCDHLGRQLSDALLDDGSGASAQQLELLVVDVDTDDRMSSGGEARG
jgi:hypothetical protein